MPTADVDVRARASFTRCRGGVLFPGNGSAVIYSLVVPQEDFVLNSALAVTKLHRNIATLVFILRLASS